MPAPAREARGVGAGSSANSLTREQHAPMRQAARLAHARAVSVVKRDRSARLDRGRLGRSVAALPPAAPLAAVALTPHRTWGMRRDRRIARARAILNNALKSTWLSTFVPTGLGGNEVASAERDQAGAADVLLDCGER